MVVFNEPLTAGLHKIDHWRNDWRAELKYWHNWKSSVSEEPDLAMVQTTFDGAMPTITTARERILQQMKPMMVAQKRAFDIQLSINEMLIELESQITRASGEFLRDVFTRRRIDPGIGLSISWVLATARWTFSCGSGSKTSIT